MKTILMPVGNGSIARNFLRGGFAELLASRGVRLVLLSPREKLQYYRSQFTSPYISWDVLPRGAVSRLERAWAFCEHASLPTSTVYLMHWFYFRRRGTKTHFLVRMLGFLFRMTLWSLGHFRSYRYIFRCAYALCAPRDFYEVLARHRPDIVFCPTLVYGGEYALIAAARRRGINTVGMPASWDNLTSKTFLRVPPNRLFVQTKIMKRDAVSFGDYPLSDITVVGAPQYDGHFKREGIVSREVFCDSLGASSGKNIILFAFSGKASFDADFEALAVLAGAFQAGALSRDAVQILVRPYPKRKLSIAEYERIRTDFGFLIEPPVARVGEGKDAWEFDKHSLALLRNSLAHASVVVTACSTFFVEAAIFGTPLVALAFGPEGADFWNGAARYFSWNHLSDLGRTGGIWRARSADELIAAIRAYLSTPSLHSAGRERIAREQAGYTDGACLERIVRELLS